MPINSWTSWYKKKPEYAVGAVNLRQLIRAQQSRLDFYQGKGIPKLFHESDEIDALFLAMHVAQLEGNTSEASAKAQLIETIRLKRETDNPASKIRDLDDSLNLYLEILGTNGEFYLARFDEIESIELKPAESFLENFWLRVEIVITDGPNGTAHLPSIYVNSASEVEKLGQVTDWEEKDELYNVGKGLKLLYINDEAVTLSELEIAQCAEA